MNSTPLVSVVIPSYNYAHTIIKCIESVIGQSYDSWELIVCDDQSNDDTWELLQKFANHDKIKIYLNEENLGLYENVTRCISYTTGEFIKIIMADDWLHSDYLQNTIHLFAKYPNIGLCSARANLVDSNGSTILTRTEPELMREFYPKDRIMSWTTQHINPIGNPTRVIFRKEAFEAAGGFDLAIEYCTEYELWLRLLEKWDYGAVPQVLCYELQHNNNATKNYTADARHILTCEQMFTKLFTCHSYFKRNIIRQQRVWFLGIRDYWYYAIKHFIEGQKVEIVTLVGMLRRRSYIIVWMPVMIVRAINVVLSKFIAVFI